MTRWRQTAVVIAVIGCVWAPAAMGGGGEVFGIDAWRKEVARLGLNPTAVVYPFTTSPEMTEWAHAAIADSSGLSDQHRLDRLQQAMFDPENFDFAYDADQTLAAKGAFDARRGNCMSFTGLFVALSRGLGIQTFLMTVEKSPDIARDGSLVVINRHVVAGYRQGRAVSIFDFYLASEAPYVGGRVIDDVMASALFHTNLGGKALRDGDPDLALGHLEIATTLAPDWAPGWVNLGVTLARLGETDGAFSSYRRVLEIDPTNSSAYTNLSSLYRSLGREQEAEVALRAAARTTESPFTLIAMADSEALGGDLRQASRYLKRAKRRYPREPEVFEGLARLARSAGHHRREEKCLAKAEKLRQASAADE